MLLINRNKVLFNILYLEPLLILIVSVWTLGFSICVIKLYTNNGSFNSLSPSVFPSISISVNTDTFQGLTMAKISTTLLNRNKDNLSSFSKSGQVFYIHQWNMTFFKFYIDILFLFAKRLKFQIKVNLIPNLLKGFF